MRYTDRERLATDGTLGPLNFDTAPDGFRVAVASLIHEGSRLTPVARQFGFRMADLATQHFGRQFVSGGAVSLTLGHWIEHGGCTLPQLLDLIEIIAEEGPKRWSFDSGTTFHTVLPDAEGRLEAMFVRFRLGYRIHDGQVRRVGSEVLDEAVLAPALAATSRPGWESVNAPLRDALRHQRGGPAERAAAITDAHAALEAAMKAMGLKGDRLDSLAKSFRNSSLVPSQLASVPEGLDVLDKLLKRSSAVRDSMSDAHGKPPAAAEIPDAIVDLMIYWTAAFIGYLAAT